MKFSDQQYAQALRAALEETDPKDYDKVIENFINLLKRQQALPRYQRIVAIYENQELMKNGISKAEITLTRESKVNPELIQTLNQLAQQDVQVKTDIDESLIGGVVIRMDDTLIDASIKTQLHSLKSELNNN